MALKSRLNPLSTNHWPSVFGFRFLVFDSGSAYCHSSKRQWISREAANVLFAPSRLRVITHKPMPGK
jgi:hypothetical protein